MILTKDNEYAVIFDACVLVPMCLCDTFLRLAEEPALYRPLWSETILQEVERALVYKLNIPAARAAKRIAAMRDAFPEAMVPVVPELVSSIQCLPDPDDRHVLAAAIREHANAIITQNTKHFPKDCLDQYGVQCDTPDNFLVHQFHLCPDQILDKLDEQSAGIHQERTYLLQTLKKMVPKFVALLEGFVGN
jgi:predicted nucleic acid-binding protein